MLNDFELARIQTPDNTSPDELRALLCSFGWEDVSERYAHWVKRSSKADCVLSELFGTHSADLSLIHQSLLNQSVVKSALIAFLETQLDLARTHRLGASAERAIKDELDNVKSLKHAGFVFHDAGETR